MSAKKDVTAKSDRINKTKWILYHIPYTVEVPEELFESNKALLISLLGTRVTKITAVLHRAFSKKHVSSNARAGDFAVLLKFDTQVFSRICLRSQIKQEVRERHRIYTISAGQHVELRTEIKTEVKYSHVTYKMRNTTHTSNSITHVQEKSSKLLLILEHIRRPINNFRTAHIDSVRRIFHSVHMDRWDRIRYRIDVPITVHGYDTEDTRYFNANGSLDISLSITSRGIAYEWRVHLPGLNKSSFKSAFWRHLAEIVRCVLSELGMKKEFLEQYFDNSDNLITFKKSVKTMIANFDYIAIPVFKNIKLYTTENIKDSMEMIVMYHNIPLSD